MEVLGESLRRFLFENIPEGLHQLVREVRYPSLSAILEKEVKEFGLQISQILLHRILVEAHQLTALGHPLGLYDEDEGVQVALALFQIVAKVEQFSIDSSSLLKWQLLNISQYYLTADILFDKSTELSEKWLPNGILLDMVGAKVLAGAPNGSLGIEYVDVVKLSDEFV